MTNRSLLVDIKKQVLNLSDDEDWPIIALASCSTLKWIGSYLCFVYICGIVLNSFVIYAIIKKKTSRSPISIFIVGLAIADLVQVLFGIPISLTSNFACRWLYRKYLCYYEAFITYFVGLTELYLLTALSLNRYWMIVTPYKVNCITSQTVYKLVFLSILGALFWAIAPIFGWSHYTLEGVRTSCSIHWQDRTLNVVSYNITMFIFAYMIPLIIIFYCNITIYLRTRHVTQKMLSQTSGCQISGNRQKENRDKRIATTVFLIILTFFIAWTPYAIVAFISSFFSPTLITPLNATLPAIFAKSSVYFNPLVYILTNSQIRSRYIFYNLKIFKSIESTISRESHADQELQRFETNSRS